MPFFVWLTMTMAFKVLSQITKGRLRCNWLTAPIAATLHIGVFIVPFAYIAQHKGKIIIAKFVLSKVFLYLGLVGVFPIVTFLTIGLCALLLPGFSIRLKALTEADYLRQKQRYTTRNAEVNQELYKLIPKPGKVSFGRYVQEVFVCSLIFNALLMGSGVVTPFLAPIVLFILYLYLEIQSWPGSRRKRNPDDPLDLYDPTNPANRTNPISPYYVRRS